MIINGPVFYYLNALGELINGTYGIFVVELILMTIAVIFCYKIARIFANRTIALLSTIITFVALNKILWFGNMTEEYVLPFTFIAMYYFIKYLMNKKIVSIQIITIGICFAASFMIRANLIAIFVGFVLVIFIDMIVRKDFKNLFLSMGYFILGALIVFLPISMYLYSKGAFFEWINQAYLSPNQYFKEITLFQKGNILHSILSSLTNYGYIFIVFYIVYVIWLYVKKIENKYKSIHLAMLLSLLVNMYLSTLSNSFFEHYCMSFIPLLILPIITALSIISENINKNKTLMLLLVALMISWKSISLCTDGIYSNIIGKYDNRFDAKVQELTNEDDYIYIFDGYQLMYRTKRLSASKYIYLPVNSNLPEEEKIDILETLLEDLKRNRPKIILISEKAYKKYSSLPYYDFNKFKELLEEDYIKADYEFFYNWYILK